MNKHPMYLLTPQQHVSPLGTATKTVSSTIAKINAGFRALGFCFFISITSALAFHVLHASCPTSPYWIPDPRFPVYLENMHWAKHGSDAESFDEEGRFNEGKFEHIVEKYDRNQKEGLYFSEIVDAWRSNRNVFNFVGWAFQVFLLSHLWILAADEAGVLHKSDARRQYDGSLDYDIRERRKMGERLPWWRVVLFPCPLNLNSWFRFRVTAWYFDSHMHPLSFALLQSLKTIAGCV